MPRLRDLYSLSLTALLLATGTIGCGTASQGPQAQITGKLTFGDQPVPEGTIQFSGTNGRGAAAEIKPDGTYKVVHIDPLPPGDYTAVVVPPTVLDSSNPNSSPIQKPKDVPQIPESVRNPKTTPLKATLKEGANTINFDLKEFATAKKK